MSTQLQLQRPRLPQDQAPALRPPSPTWLMRSLSGDQLSALVRALNLEVPPNLEASELALKEHCFSKLLSMVDVEAWEQITELKELVNQIDFAGRTLLMECAARGNLLGVQELSSRQISVLQKGPDGQTPLHLAAQYGQEHVVKPLVESAFCSVDALDERYASPVHVAAATGSTAVLRDLLDRGAKSTGHAIWDFGSGQILQLSPLALAVAYDHWECVEVLMKEPGRDFTVPLFGTIVHLAAYFNNSEMLSKILTLKPELLDVKGFNGRTALALASFMGSLESLQVLHDFKASVEILDQDDRTPLHWAILGAQSEALQFFAYHYSELLDRGNSKGEYPIVLAKQLATDFPSDERELIKRQVANLRAQKTRSDISPPNFQKQPPINLVFQGGGPAGIAHVGVYAQLKEQGLDKEIRRVAGTSAGAIMGALVSVGMSVENILAIVGSDTRKYLDLTPEGEAFLRRAGQRDLEAAVANYRDVIGSILKSVAVGGAKKRWKQLIGALFGFAEHGIAATWLGGSKETLQGYPAGLCKGKALEDEIEKAISKETGIERCTFAELGELCRTNSKKFKHLWVTVTKVHRSGDVSVERLTSERVATDKGPRWYDNVIVSSAVRASSNLPFVFEPCILKTKDPATKIIEEREAFGQFLDGGMLANLDIEIFDAQHFQTQRVFLEDEGLRHKMNKRTLGIALVNQSERKAPSDALPGFKVEDPLSLVQAVVKVYRSSEETLRALKPYNKRRIIEVDRIGVAATDFSLSDDKKKELFASGQNNLETFFSAKVDPSPSVRQVRDPSPPVEHRRGEAAAAEGSFKREPTRAERQALRAFSVPPRKEHDIERPSLFAQIESALDQDSAVVLHGITGSGKTRLAEAIARKKSEEKLVYWIRASEGGLVQSYIQLALKLMLVTEEDLKSPQGEEKAIQAVKKYFETASDVLLVLDDVTTEEELTHNGIALLPKGQGQVLLTRTIITSQSMLFRDKQLVEVDCLEPAEAANLLQQTLGSEVSNELLLELAELLYYHPLLINMTGCYMRELAAFEGKSVEIVVQEEVEKLKASAVELPKGKLDPETRKGLIHQAVERRWEINLERAQAYERQFVEESTVGKVLGICGYLAPTGIPVNWFDEAHRRSFQTMKLFGFCDQLEGSDVVDMHSLVQLFSRRKDCEFKALKVAADLVEAKWGYEEEEHLIPEKVKLNSLHVISVVNYLKKSKIQAEQLAKLQMFLGRLFQTEARFNESKKALEEALITLQGIYGEEVAHPHIAHALRNLGLVAREQGELPRAKAFLERALAMVEMLYDKDSLRADKAEILLNLGLVYRGQGELMRARSLSEQALEIMQKLFSDDFPHPSTAAALINLGEISRHQGELERAKQYSHQAHTMMQELYENGFFHPGLIIAMMNLGIDALEQGELISAEEYLEQTLGFMHKFYGEDVPHPRKASVLNNLACVALMQGRHTFARQRFEQAYAMLESLHGVDKPHPDMALALMNIGRLACEKGQFSLAKNYLKQALTMMQKLYGEEAIHPDVAKTLFNLGIAHRMQLEYREAKLHFEHALKLMERIYDPEAIHPEKIKLLGALGTLACDQGELEQARSYLEQALAMTQKLYGDEALHPDKAIVLADLGRVAREQKNYVQGRQYLERALDMMQMIHGEGSSHPHTAVILMNLGAVIFAQFEPLLAKRYFEQAHKMMQEIYGEGSSHPDMLNVLWNLKVTNEAIKKFPNIHLRKSELEAASVPHAETSKETQLEKLLEQLEHLEAKTPRELEIFLGEVQQLWTNFETDEHFNQLFIDMFTRAQERLHQVKN